MSNIKTISTTCKESDQVNSRINTSGTSSMEANIDFFALQFNPYRMPPRLKDLPLGVMAMSVAIVPFAVEEELNPTAAIKLNCKLTRFTYYSFMIYIIILHI